MVKRQAKRITIQDFMESDEEIKNDQDGKIKLPEVIDLVSDDSDVEIVTVTFKKKRDSKKNEKLSKKIQNLERELSTQREANTDLEVDNLFLRNSYNDTSAQLARQLDHTRHLEGTINANRRSIQNMQQAQMTLQERIRLLERDNRELRMENDVLRGAVLEQQERQQEPEEVPENQFPLSGDQIDLVVAETKRDTDDNFNCAVCWRGRKNEEGAVIIPISVGCEPHRLCVSCFVNTAQLRNQCPMCRGIFRSFRN